MASYNKVLLMGNLTRDIELRHTPNNQTVATIGLAVNRRYRTADGTVKEETTFVDCDAWGKTAETMSKYLSKGRPVFIEGHLRLDQWKDQEGNNRSKLKVVIENFQFVDSKGGGGGGGSGGDSPSVQTRAPRSAQPAAGGANAGYEPIQDDDIPF